MSESTIWLIYHKALNNEGASQSMDGSALSYGIAAVPEKDLGKALSLLKDDLSKDNMTLVEIYKCLRADSVEMPGEEELEEDVGYIIRTAKSRNAVSMITIGDESID